jgi:alanine racemase
MVVDRLKAEINLNNLYHNYTLLKALNNGKDLYAVVKADAYGHGAVECSKFLQEKGVKHFAVTVLKEAIELREAGIKQEIMIFGKTDPLNSKYLYDFNIVQTIDSYEYARSLDASKYKIKVHLNIDTGMSRLGLKLHSHDDLDSVIAEIRRIKSLNNISVVGMYSHFTSADSDLEFTLYQQKLFDTLIHELKSLNIDYGKVHLLNSGGLIKLDKKNYDLARAGITLYGYPPCKTDMNFLPVMNLYAKIIAIREISEGDTVSYGRTFKASQKTKVATVAIGYADGLPRILSNNDYFVFEGNRLPILGRVCMGLTMIDVSKVEIKEGDFVEVFGYNKDLEGMAERAGTITYELLTNMAKPRVDRIYIK